MRSLGKTLVLGTTLAAAAIFVASGLLLYLLARANLLAQFDQSLCEGARLLASTVERTQGRIELEFQDLDFRDFEGPHPSACLKIFAADGSTLYRSAAADGLDPVPSPVRTDAPLIGRFRFPDGGRGRAVSLAFLPRVEGDNADENGDGRPQADAASNPAGEPLTLVLGRSSEAVDQTLARLVGALLLVGLVAVGVSTATLWWFVRHSFRPLERLAADIGRLGEADLADEIGLGAGPREIQPVIDRLNDLLRRLDAAFRRERAFSANVAHELRNPLAGLRLKMDVANSRTRQPLEYRQTIAECCRITAEMQRMVENLLTLGRLESGQTEVHREPVPLDELIRQLWQPLETAAGERGLRVDWALEPGLTLVSDRSLLAVAIRNVLENAVIHADRNGSIRIAATGTDRQAELSVSNSGSSLSQEQAEQAFARFWRGDPARSDIGVHCGLGLSLARTGLAILGGAASVRSEAGGDFQITLVLPRQ
jgi:two-component system sensor histidine kinase QseC